MQDPPCSLHTLVSHTLLLIMRKSPLLVDGVGADEIRIGDWGKRLLPQLSPDSLMSRTSKENIHLFQSDT